MVVRMSFQQVCSRFWRMVANVVAPRRLTVLAATREQVWGTLPDENDVPLLVRYRLQSAASR